MECQHPPGDSVRTRIAVPTDATAIARDLADGFESYREWAPPSWKPPSLGEADLEQLQARLEDDDVWCLLALDGEETVGHVALSLKTAEDPGPPPPGVVNCGSCSCAAHGEGKVWPPS